MDFLDQLADAAKHAWLKVGGRRAAAAAGRGAQERGAV